MEPRNGFMKERKQERFFLNSNLNVRFIHTSTSTVYSTTSTIATTYRTDLTCIAYDLVKDAAAAAQVCRKRRHVADVRDALGLDPSPPAP